MSNRKAAGAMQQEHRAAITRGLIHPNDPWPTVQREAIPNIKDFAPRFLAQHFRKSGTKRFYSVQVERLLSYPALASASMDDPKITEIVSRYVAWRRSGESPDAVSTVRNDLTTLVRMFRCAMNWGVPIERLPKIEKPTGVVSRDRVLTYEEEMLYLAAAKGTHRDLSILNIETGVRPDSELFTLRWTDVDLNSREGAPFGVIHIRDRENDGSGLKTDASARTVPLMSDRSRQVLLARRKAHTTTSPFVFPGHGASGHIENQHSQHRRVIKRIGITHFPPYTFRHTFASRCAHGGMDRFTLARLMGHSSTKMVEQYYVHVTESHMAHGVEKAQSFHAQQLAEIAEKVNANKAGA
jgi:integrase